MVKGRRYGWLLVAGVMGGLLIAACESDDGAGDDGAGTGSTANPSGGGGPLGGSGPFGGTSSGGSSGTPGSGGAPAGGGGTSTGGSATGGAPSTGGAPATGGVPGTGGGGACDGGPLTTSLPNCEIDPPASTGDYHQDCVNYINAFRWQCHCLPPLERWVEGEACADQMAEYDFGAQQAHAGFSSDLCEGGTGQCECPGWGSVESITEGSDWGESCLAMMWHEVDNPSGEQGHYEAMSSTRFTRVACGVYDSGEEVWAVQNYAR